jgi:hypothetical protein
MYNGKLVKLLYKTEYTVTYRILDTDEQKLPYIFTTNAKYFVEFKPAPLLIGALF